MLDCVILDMDGTLLDTEANSVSAWQLSGRRMGVEIPKEFILGHFGMSRPAIDQRYRDAFGPDFPIDAIRQERNRESMRIAREEPVPVKPGARELLAHLRKAGIPAVVATSSVGERADLLLKRGGLWDSLAAVVSGEQVSRSKPEPDIFLEAARRVGADPGRSLVVEDSESGARAGLAAGMAVAVVPDLSGIRPEVLAKTRVCATLLEVIPLVEELRR